MDPQAVRVSAFWHTADPEGKPTVPPGATASHTERLPQLLDIDAGVLLAWLRGEASPGELESARRKHEVCRPGKKQQWQQRRRWRQWIRRRPREKRRSLVPALHSLHQKATAVSIRIRQAKGQRHRVGDGSSEASRE